MTAGFILKNGHIVLDNEVLEIVAEKQKAAVFAKERSRAKSIEECKTHKKEALAVLLSSQTEEEVKKTKNDELKAVVIFKKRKGDDAMPTTKIELINRYNATVARPDLLLGAYLIDVGHELINGVMV